MSLKLLLQIFGGFSMAYLGIEAVESAIREWKSQDKTWKEVTDSGNASKEDS